MGEYDPWEEAQRQAAAVCAASGVHVWKPIRVEWEGPSDDALATSVRYRCLRCEADYVGVPDGLTVKEVIAAWWEWE